MRMRFFDCLNIKTFLIFSFLYIFILCTMQEYPILLDFYTKIRHDNITIVRKGEGTYGDTTGHRFKSGLIRIF